MLQHTPNPPKVEPLAQEWRRRYVVSDVAKSTLPTAVLTTEAHHRPHHLAANASLSSIGSCVLGMGFALQPEEAQRPIARDPRTKDVLFPYLNGEDPNSRPDRSPSRWMIDCFDRPLERSARGSWAGASATPGYHGRRSAVTQPRPKGLTDVFHRFHAPGETDQAVAAAHGGGDLDLSHGFEAPQGVRYTISPPARDEVLDRLLALNRERYEEEVRQGLHEGKKGGPGIIRESPGQYRLGGWS